MKKQHARIMLAIGAAVGIVMGAIGAFEPGRRGPGQLPDGVVARINDTIITAETLSGALNETAGDQPTTVDGEQRGAILNRLIDEELLVQHGLEIGLADSNQTVREAIAMAATQTILEQSSSAQPSEQQLKEFYEDQYGDHNKFLFDQLRDQVASAYRRSVDEKTVRDHLDWLWGEAEITIRKEQAQ